MAEVIGIVDVLAAEGKADEVVAAFTTCLIKTHEEEGCLTYALHRDNADPSHLVLVERWRSQDDLDAHMATPHVADLLGFAATPGMLAEPPRLAFTTALPSGGPKGTLGD